MSKSHLRHTQNSYSQASTCQART